MPDRVDGRPQRQAGGATVLFTQYALDGLDDLAARDQHIERVDSTIAQLTAYREQLRAQSRAQIALMRAATIRQHAVLIDLPAAITRLLRRHGGRDMSGAELTALARSSGGRGPG